MSSSTDHHQPTSAVAPAFTLPVDPEVDLVLRETWTAGQLLPLIHANLERLRAWEAWAQGDQTLEGLQSFTRSQLADWLDGRAVPTMIRHHGQPAGSLGARIDPWHGNAELGYWVAAEHQGKGIVHRGASALIDYLVNVRGLERVEIRTVHTNTRSRAVAERLGFAPEGQLTEAMSLHGRRQDVVLYGLTASQWRRARGSAPRP